MVNNSITSQEDNHASRIDRLGETAEKIANSRLYKLSPVIAGLAIVGVVAVGINRGLTEEPKIPEKLDHSITVVDK